jgi:hypothetical protein
MGIRKIIDSLPLRRKLRSNFLLRLRSNKNKLETTTTIFFHHSRLEILYIKRQLVHGGWRGHIVLSVQLQEWAAENTFS